MYKCVLISISDKIPFNNNHIIHIIIYLLIFLSLLWKQIILVNKRGFEEC